MQKTLKNARKHGKPLGSSRNGDDRMNLEKRSKGSSVGGVGYVRTPSLAMPQ